MHKLTYKKSALKALRKMPRAQAEKLQSELEATAQDPYAYKGDWKPMKGAPFWCAYSGPFRSLIPV